MAVRWSSENVVAEHRDLQANAMALDWRGEYTLLAGRRNLALISLDKPSEVVKRVSRTRQKYDVTAAEWNPIQCQGHTFVLASGERAEICQWTEGSLNGTTSLRAHTRTITDLNWHRFDPHILATCSIDTFVHIWDTRETRKPVASLSAIAGASQVKWNKLNRNFLASGHDCNIRVWDNRKTSQPAQYIAAHLSKIQGLDWSPNHENHLVTSSNDCTVKFFDVTNPRKAENFINTLSPVWRARYTPFGEGVVTVVVPQLRRGENSLLLWSVTEMSSPVHTFVGHSDVVLEFEWRQNTNNPGEHQLVTWARDHSLRIWKIDQQLQRLCGHDAEDDAAFVESTDSEFANEATAAQGESQCDVESFIEKDVKDAEEDTMDLEEDTEQKCTPNSAEYTQEVSHENSPEIGSTAGDAPQMSASEVDQTMNDHATGEAANVTVLQPVTSFSNTLPSPCRTNNAVVGMSSTLPSGSISAGQPMSLQQEFSLLNTSLDNSQVNSVEVVGGGAKILADAGDRTQGPQVTQPGGEEGSLEARLENIACEEARLDAGDGSGLVAAVESLEQELNINNLDNCPIRLMENQKSFIDVYNEDIISCQIKPVASFNKELRDYKQRITCNVMHQLALKKTDNEIKPIATSYITGLETSNHDLISKVNFDTSSMCIIKVKSSTNYPGIKSQEEEEQADYTNKEESPVRISVNSEGGNQVPIQPVTRDSESLVLMPGDLEASFLREVLEVKEISANKDISKEETVIHVIDSGNMSSNVDTPECSTTAGTHYSVEAADTPVCSTTADTHYSVVEAADASCESQILLRQPVIDNVSSTLSLSLIDTQNTLNAAVMDGSLMVKGSDDTLLNVPAKLIYIPDAEDGISQFSEEMCAAFSPQLFQGGVLVPGENIVFFGNQSFLTNVELVLVEGETQTQISISPLTESVKSYQDRGVNFVIITSNLEQTIALSNSSEAFLKVDLDTFPERKFPVKNAPHSDAPGLFQCDKCDKTYKVRSSLNSHKVTHNAEKMYKCDECDKAFHYSTPLQIHKRIHNDERPYKCQSCTASFRSKANLRYHERLHTGERPITCRECSQGFKDYTSLKRHRQKAHDIMNIRCDECGQMCNSIDNLTNHLWQSHNIFYVDKILFCEKCGEALADQKAYNIHVTDHECKEKISRGTPGKLSDYIHQCGICRMVCQNKPQMLVHIQIHAAINRFQCRYCKNAYMYRFLLARHVREEHPDDPPWFCQHCDVTFETCRKMNTHSCRTVRGDYTCPHCDFKTEIRHRLFRHIIKEHPSDKAPYYCDFCKSSYEDPSKLRYHQKREHPEKMLMLTMHRETSKHVHAAGDKTDSSSIDMSLVEMTIKGNTIIYYIPKHLRNDDVFKEKVKFKCFYCEAKFPVKNSMTRHILREHPSEKAYKCLQCNIFLRSNVESKNHNRKYHKYSDTGGRDPLRNEKAMKKKAQMLEEQMKHAGAQLKSVYKFRCRFCSMVYRCKRPLIVHYTKWHPDEEWDHFPDKPSRSTTMPSKKKRKLLFFDCVFDDQCQRVFDDLKMLLDHLANAHSINNKEANQYIHKRVVMEAVRRGRLPRNAIDVVTNANCKNRRTRRKRTIKAEAEDEDDVDDPTFCKEEFDIVLDSVVARKSHNEVTYSSLNDAQKTKSSVLLESVEKKQKSSVVLKKAGKRHMNLDDIDSVRDVKKMLYRCRKCGISFSNKIQYREHSSQYSEAECCDQLPLNVKQEPESATEDFNDYSNSDDNYQLSSGQEDDESDEGSTLRRNNKSKNIKIKEKGLTSNFNSFVKTEMQNVHENITKDIVITSLEEDSSENVLKVLTISASELEQPQEQIKVELITSELSHLKTRPRSLKESEASKLNVREISFLALEGEGLKREGAGKQPDVGKQLESDNSCSKYRSCQSSERKIQLENRKTSKISQIISELPDEGNGRDSKLPLISKPSKGLAAIVPRGRRVRATGSRSRSIRNAALQTTQCDECRLIFKTRAELSFHKRLDHRQI